MRNGSRSAKSSYEQLASHRKNTGIPRNGITPYTRSTSLTSRSWTPSQLLLPTPWHSPSVNNMSRHRLHRTSRSPEPPADLGGKALEEFGVIGALRRLPHALVEPVGVVADQNAPALGLDAIEDDLRGRGRRGRRFLEEAARALGGDRPGYPRPTSAPRRCRMPASRCARLRDLVRRSGASESVPLCTLRELETIEVPIWPGITTEHLMCGALSRRSLISASVNPFTANLAAL